MAIKVLKEKLTIPKKAFKKLVEHLLITKL